MPRFRPDLAGVVTPFGRRVLMRQCMITRNGDVGAKALAKELGCRESTVWAMLRNRDEDWHSRPEWIDIAARLCLLLKVDHSWLFQTRYYDDEIEKIRFDLDQRRRWQ